MKKGNWKFICERLYTATSPRLFGLLKCQFLLLSNLNYGLFCFCICVHKRLIEFMTNFLKLLYKQRFFIHNNFILKYNNHVENNKYSYRNNCFILIILIYLVMYSLPKKFVTEIISHVVIPNTVFRYHEYFWKTVQCAFNSFNR